MAPPASAGSSAVSSSPAQSAAPLSPPVALNVGVSQSLNEAGLYVGLEKGNFSQQGLDVSTTLIPSFEQMVPLLATGKLDIGVGGIVPGLFNAYTRGAGIRIVAAASSWLPNRSNALIVRKGLIDAGQLNSYADLKGKTIGKSTPLSTFDAPLEKAYSLGGFTANDVKSVTLTFADMLPAMANNAIDAAFLPEPYATNAVEKGVGVRWKQAGELVPNQPASLWVFSQNLIDNQSEAGRRFTVELLRGVRDYENAVTKGQDRQQVIAALTAHTTVKDPALYDKMVMTYDPTSGEIDMTQLQNLVELFKSHGGITESPDLSKMVDTEFTDFAVSRLGSYK